MWRHSVAAAIRWRTAPSCCLAKKRRYIYEPISVLTQDSYCCMGQVLESTDTATDTATDYPARHELSFHCVQSGFAVV
jgi:hypothetical protein